MTDFVCLMCAKPEDDNATFFRSEGNYGSTLFDPMDGSFIDMCICNSCLKPLAGRMWEGRDRKPVKYNSVCVGWAPTPNRNSVPFDPERVYQHEGDDVLYISLDEVGNTELLPEIQWDDRAVNFIRRMVASMGVEDADYISDECLFMNAHTKCGDDGVCWCKCHSRQV